MATRQLHAQRMRGTEGLVFGYGKREQDGTGLVARLPAGAVGWPMGPFRWVEPQRESDAG